MSTDPATPTSNDPAPAVPQPTQPGSPARKKVRLLRPSAIILLLLLVVLAFLAVPLLLEPWVAGTIRSQLGARGLKLNDDCTIGVSLFGGRLHLANLQLTEAGQTVPVLTAELIDADLAVTDSLRSGDVILDSLIARKVGGSFRRRADGTVPMSPPAQPGSDWSKLNWTQYAEKALEQWKKRREQRDAEQKKQEDDAKLPPDQRPPPPPAQPAKDGSGKWPEAVVYKPSPRPGTRPVRVLIRNLEVSGAALGLPDETPFDLTAFTITGSDVALRALPDETMKLAATIDTRGAGAFVLDLLRTPGDRGTLNLVAKQLPLRLLADPRVSGDRLAACRPSGTGVLNLTSSWKGDALDGKLASTLKDFDLDPQAGAPSEAAEVARVAKELKGQEFAGPGIDLGGTIYAPSIAQVHVGEFVKGAAEAAARNRAATEIQKQADKLLDKNPGLKQVTETAPVKKGLDALKNLGK